MENNQEYELYNVDTEEVEAVQEMTPMEASDRNSVLRRLKEPYRWIKKD